MRMMEAAVEESKAAKHLDILNGLSHALQKSISEQSKDSAFMYLIRQGIPQTPADVLALFDSVYVGAIVWAVAAEFASLTEAGTASDDERAETMRMTEGIEALLSQLNGVGEGEALSPTPSTGTYL